MKIKRKQGFIVCDCCGREEEIHVYQQSNPIGWYTVRRQNQEGNNWLPEPPPEKHLARLFCCFECLQVGVPRLEE